MSAPRPNPFQPHPSPSADAVREPARTPQSQQVPSPLGRLAALHDEAAQTARLANLLGRMPWLAVALAVGALAGFAYTTQIHFQFAPAVWVLFTLAAGFALLRLYRHAVRSPFELFALRAFQADLKALMLYAGFAWGAGLFFGGAQLNLLNIIVFSTGMTAIAELIVRNPNTVLPFAIPAILVPAVAVALGPRGLASAGIVVVAGACVIAAADIIARLSEPRAQPALVTVS